MFENILSSAGVKNALEESVAEGAGNAAEALLPRQPGRITVGLADSDKRATAAESTRGSLFV